MTRRTDHDPGDAVPPGVAPVRPVPLSPEDRKVKEKLERGPNPDRLRNEGGDSSKEK